MKALLPELEEHLSTLEIPNDGDSVVIKITDDNTNTIVRIVRRRYAYALQTIANIIGIRVVVTEEISKNKESFEKDRQAELEQAQQETNDSLEQS